MDFQTDEAIAELNIIKILSNYKSFRKWLRNYHKITKDEDYLEGYKYLVSICIQWFIESLSIGDIFKLKDDDYIIRAHFIGHPLNEIPNSSEKTIFCKNVWNLSKPITSAKTWKELEATHDLDKLNKIFDIIMQKYVKTKLDSLDYGLKVTSMFYAYIFLIDTSHGYPKAALGSFFKINKNPKFLNAVFQGYVYGLQFLWYSLMEKNEFEDSPLKNLHLSQKLYGKRAKEITNSRYEWEEIDEEIKFRKEVRQKWIAFDQFFNELRSNVIRPMENKINLVLDKHKKRVFIIKKINKSILKELLIMPTEPDYLLKNDRESIIKQLDQQFFWYPISHLDLYHGFELSGAYTFISILKGYSQILDESEHDTDKILVRIIKHPSPATDGGNDITFAVLVGVYGIFTGEAGWFIFPDSATDYSGYGGSLYQKGQDVIEKLKKQNKVKVETLTISRQHFEWYLKEKSYFTTFKKTTESNSDENTKLHKSFEQQISKIKFNEKNKIKKIKHNAKQHIRKSNAKLFEYLVYKWVIDYNNSDLAKVDIKIADEQIDCMIKKDKIIEIYECKLQLHDPSELVKQLDRKKLVLEKKYNDMTIYKNAVIFEDISHDRQNILESAGIRVYHAFKSKIRTSRIFNGSTRELLDIFNLDSM